MVEAAVFVAFSVATLLLLSAWPRREAALRRRLDELSGPSAAAPSVAAAPLSDPAAHTMPVWVRVAVAVAVPLVVVAILAVTGVARAEALVPAAFLAAGGLFFAPGLFTAARARRRRAAILHSLPDVLDLLVICVEAGLGLNAAFQRVAERIALPAPELAEAFRAIHQQIQAGRSREEALRSMAARVGVEELRSLSLLLIQTDRLGTSVADALRIHSDALRARFHHAAEARAAKATVHLAFPLVLCIFPALLAVVVGPAAVTLLEAIGGKP